MSDVSVIDLDSDQEEPCTATSCSVQITEKSDVKKGVKRVCGNAKILQDSPKKGEKRKKEERPDNDSPAKKPKLGTLKSKKTDEKKGPAKETKKCEGPSTSKNINSVPSKPAKSKEVKPQINVDWKVETIIAEKLNLNYQIVRNVIRLFEAENTIPFIARYRKEETGCMEPEMLRHVKDNHDRLLAVKQKMESVVSTIMKMNKMTPPVMDALRSAQTLNEIEHVYAQFKSSGARTLAERARVLGLEPAAIAVLHGTEHVNIETLVNEKTKSISKVLQGLQHIIADVISKSKVVLDSLRNLCEKNKYAISVESKQITEKTEKMKKESAKKKVGSGKLKEQDAEKFEMYFSFKASVQTIKPHQVLAICRGESLKVLSVKVILPDWFFNTVKQVCFTEWFSKGLHYPFRNEILTKSLEDSYTRLLQPHMIRHIRNNLQEEAHLASIEVFAQNLKHLLLTPPIRGEVVLGIDPGFKHGCKLAVVNSNGDVLATNVVYIHSGYEKIEDNKLIQSLLLEHQCEIIALGNGTACRETEKWISSLINEGYFNPLKVKYTIVDEQGVSIYSCSSVAKKEFPNMDPNLISAVSLARRLQDPLSELVKVEPKHLGVGMYQHDIPEKKLSSTLDEIVVECVSFVGVDVNTASATLLRYIAGLNATKAANILDWRSKNGPFLNRDQLHQVKGLGPKSFEQCAGFLRILSKTSSLLCFGDIKDQKVVSKSKKKSNVACESRPNPLDQTWIHPESYSIVYWFLELCGTQLSDFGSPEFLNKVQTRINNMGIQSIASQANVSEEKLKLVFEGLKQKPDNDFRSQFQKPLFRSVVTSVNDLKVGTSLTGRVHNVTHFGAFVDIGVGHDGLLHISQMRRTTLNLGDRLEVTILNIDIGAKKPRIGLGLSRVL